MLKPTVLLVDDEPDLLTLLQVTLARMDLETDTAETVSAARAALARNTPSLCLTDMKLPDGTGLELIAHIQQQYPNVPVAMMTAHGSIETAIEALKLGAFDFVSKPVSLDRLRDLVTQALKLIDLGAPETHKRLIGDTPVMAALKKDIQRVARSEAPVHIHGESGVGKEVVARLIHESSARAEGPFIAVNCGAIPADLVESELFGHRKGSFTGATSDKTGLFQAAAGGTLLLDEVADLPLAVQVKLLRAIQEKAVRPVGSEQEVLIDVRLVSATHKSLTTEVSAGRFRDDLFYRINVIDLLVPALRHRRDDIPLLAEHLLSNLARESKRPHLQLSEAAKDRLRAHDYPGNIRELDNILTRSVALLEGDLIEADDLALQSQLQAPTEAPKTESGSSPALHDSAPVALEMIEGNFDRHLQEVERTLLEEALNVHRWNRTATAKFLGITLRSLRHRLKKLGLDD